MKTACENTGKALSGGSGSGSLGTLGSFLGLNGSFDWRHFMIRVAEFGIGITLVVVAANAGLKQSVMGSPVVKSGKQIAKKVAK
jgi:hypothetical protein